MSGNPNSRVHVSNKLAYIQSIVNETWALTVDLGHNEWNYLAYTRIHENPSQNYPKLPIIVDGKFYYPYMQFKGIKIRRVGRSTTRKHCLKHGHLEGGNQYQPFVR